MATISLFEYLETVNQLLDEERYAEAKQHCRHILSKFPRHIETYRLLAKAHLGQHEYAQAIELFQRVLSADPNDFISHIALSDLFQSESQMDRARWHLERAFELEPYNKAVQDALRRFYAEENGNAEMVAGRLPLTPVAAANIYLRGDLYQSGVDILHETMAESPARIDSELLLAELLWRSGDRVEAADLCLRILEQLPDCVTANAILAQIWLNSGRTDDAKPHLFKVQMLTQMDQVHFDPETAVGAALATDGAAFLPDEVTIEPLERVEDALSLSEADAEWEPDVTPPAETEADLEGESGDMLEWLSGVSTEAEPAAVPADAPDESVEPPETDWFFDRAAEGEDTGDLVPSVSEWFGSDWDAETEPEPADEPMPDDTELESEAAMADYLQQEAPELSDSDSGLEAFMQGAPASDSESAPEVPEWLAAENEAEQDFDSQPSDFAEPDLAADDSDDDVESDMPNWLAEMTETDFDAVELDPSSASEFLAPDEASEEIDAAPADVVEGDEAADWLAELSGDIDAIGADEVDSVDFTSDWLAVEDDEAAEVDSQPAAEVAESDAAEFAGDWLSDLPGDAQDEIFSSEWLEPEQAASSQEADAEEGAAETAASQSETDWLAALSEEEGAAADEDWLADLSLESEAEADAVAGEPPTQEAEQEPEAAAPESDWLSSLTEDEEAAAAGDWLAELATGSADQTWADDEDDDFAVEAEIDDTGGMDDWLADLSRPTDELSEPETAVGDHAAAAEEPSAAQEATAADVPPDDLDQFQDVEADLMGIPGDENDKEEQEKMPEPEEAQDAASEEEMDWLDALALPEEEDEEEAAAEDDVDSMLAEMSMEVEDDDLPDWLKESSSAVGDEDSEAADVPDWLLESTNELFETADSADLFAADVASEESQPLAEPEEDVASEPMEAQPEEEMAPDEPDAVTGPPTSLLSEMTPETVDVAADEEDLEWLSQLGDEDDEESVPALDWLSEMESDEPEEAPEPETAVASTAVEAPDEADIDEYEDYGDEESLPEIPSDLDDAMSWLEDLAAEQDTPIEPLPTVADVLDEEEEDAPSQEEAAVAAESEEPVAEEAAAPEPEESLDEAMAELDDTLSWLDNLSEEAGALDEASADFVFEDAEEEAVPDSATAETADEAEADVEPTPDMVADVPEDLEEAMAWLESLAAKQGAPLEELPSLSAEEELPVVDEDIGESAPPTDVTQEPVPDAEADDDLFDVDDEIGDAMGWLDELAAGEATLDEAEAAEPEEEETAVIPEQETEPEAAPISAVEETSEPALDQDLAAELDWLESVAMTDSEVVDVDVSEASVETSDEELTEALDWLAEMALADETEPEASETAVDAVPEPDVAEAETAVDELTADTGEVEALAEEAPEPEVDRPEPTTEESMADEALFESTDDIFDIPDDPDEAMAWLQEIAAEDVPEEAVETTEPADEVPVDEAPDVEETDVEETAVVPEAEAPAEEADFTEDFLAEVPEDPDEAMAWLEQLAARQGADLEELPTVSEVSEDVETPDWITAAAEQEEEAAEAEPAEPVAGAPESEAIDEEVAEIGAESEATVEDVAEPEPEAEEDEASTPGWLLEETAVDEEVPDEAEWLDTIPEMDITGWLESEEEASVKGSDAPTPLPETGPLIAPESETGPPEEPDVSVVAETPSREMVPSMLHVDEDQLESARSALAEGDVTQAVTRYQSLVASGEGLMVLIGELETAASENEDEPAIRRLLGDAYMRNGQLQKALSVYREALDRL